MSAIFPTFCEVFGPEDEAKWAMFRAAVVDRAMPGLLFAGDSRTTELYMALPGILGLEGNFSERQEP